MLAIPVAFCLSIFAQIFQIKQKYCLARRMNITETRMPDFRCYTTEVGRSAVIWQQILFQIWNAS